MVQELVLSKTMDKQYSLYQRTMLLLFGITALLRLLLFRLLPEVLKQM